MALLLAAALALAVLVGCGSGQQSAVQALLKLLDGKYPNISIEIDPDLEADLRQAISQAEAENAGDDDAVIRAALEKLVGSTVTFRNLGEGQQGDTTFDLVFYAGTDPDKAAQTAYSQWNLVFSNVPDDGKYGTGLAMVETENGIWMLVKATVEKAGRPDRPESEPDEPETQEPEKGPTEVGYEDDDYSVTWADEDNNQKLFTVKASGNLENLFDTLLKENPSETFENIIIKLTANETYTVNTTNGPLAKTFKGELQGNGATVTITGGTQGLFNSIGDFFDSTGTVKDLTIDVGTISGRASSSDLGAVAGTNYGGTIQNCHIKGNTIESTNVGPVGGIVGDNRGTIQGCSSAAAVNGGSLTGGIAGYNNGNITACYSTGNVTGTTGEGIICAGGVVGYNYNGCKVTACYSTGEVTGKSSGGVVGLNNGSVTACYWESILEAGIGDGTDTTTKVTGSWTDGEDSPMSKMNEALQSVDSDWRYEMGTGGNPPLTLTKN